MMRSLTVSDVFNSFNYYQQQALYEICGHVIEHKAHIEDPVIQVGIRNAMLMMTELQRKVFYYLVGLCVEEANK